MAPVAPDGAGWPADVLIVEDDPIIAIDFEDRVLGLGVAGVRTVGSVAQALGAIAKRAPDFALLDVELIRETSFAVAERLVALKIPFVFVTGYGAEARILQPATVAEAVFERRAGGGAKAARHPLERFPAKQEAPPLSSASDRAWSTTVRRRRGRAGSPSSGPRRRRS